jgi:HK97 family phage major capsid protein
LHRDRATADVALEVNGMTTSLSAVEIRDRQTAIKARFATLESKYSGRTFPDDVRAEWNTLKSELENLDATMLERASRIRALEALSRDASHVEGEVSTVTSFSKRTDFVGNMSQALRAVDRLHTAGEIPESGALRLDHVVREDRSGREAEYIAAASDPNYATAFGKVIKYGPNANHSMTDKERDAVNRSFESMRAVSIGGTGGFAVPITLDPTVIPTSVGSLNTLRQVARVETIVGNVWEGVSSDGVIAAFSAEATEASDNSPTLAQPTANVEKAQAFVPFSIEIGEDWVAIQEELRRMFLDAKDLLESTKFIAGLGHGSHEPEGLLVGGTAIVTTGSTATITVSDVYSVKNALGPRWQPRASWVASPTNFDRVRRLVGPGNTTELPVWEDSGPRILRRPALENSGMPTTVTSGSTVLTYGDFSQFLIADRVGAQVEIIPHLFGSGNRFPTGQRGAYMYWRTTSKCLNVNAFKSLKAL